MILNTPKLRDLVLTVILPFTVALSQSSQPLLADDKLPAETKSLITKLIEDTKSKQAATRAGAYKALGELGEKAKGQRRALCEGMLDSAPTVRAAAADSLQKVDEQFHKLALGILINGQTKDVETAGRLGPAGEPLSPLVLTFAKTLAPTASSASNGVANEEARSKMHVCIVALVAIAPEDEKVNQAVIAMVNNSRPELRALAINNLPPLKNKKLALKGVLAAASNPMEEESLRVTAVKLVHTLIDENTAITAKKALEALRFDKSEKVREAVAKTLENFK